MNNWIAEKNRINDMNREYIFKDMHGILNCSYSYKFYHK